MSDRRIEIEDLGGLSDLPPEDPRRKALESQPSARAQMRAYREFMSPGDDPVREQRREAEARLAEALARELGIAGGAATDTAAHTRSTRSDLRSQSARSPFLSWLGAGSPRLAMGLAAVLILIAGGALIFRMMNERGGEQLRGSITPPASGTWDARPTVESSAEGGIVLRWSAAPGADAYAVVFLGSDLAEVARVADLRGPKLVLERESLPHGLVPGAHALWRVMAYHGADEIGRSSTSPLVVP
jgi:hypothetical protein